MGKVTREGAKRARAMFVVAMAACMPTSYVLAADGPKLTPAMRTAVVTHLEAELKVRYVFPDVAGRIATDLAANLKAGRYDQDVTTEAFADHLSRDIRASGNDRHLMVQFAPKFRSPPAGDPPPPTKADLDEEQAWVDKDGAGIATVRRLPGNIGYIDLRQFPPADFVVPRYKAAMQLLAGSEGIIIDLRQNLGGDPHAVALLLSYFFRENDGRHLNDMYWRKDGSTDQFHTFPVDGERLLSPVYVLTSARTFSAGEEAAYDFQTQKRGTLIGATTGGGANPGGMFALSEGFIAFIPAGRAINPVTKTNWEHVGVKPDIEIAPEKAFSAAYSKLIDLQLKAAKDPEEQDALRKALSDADHIEAPVPDYTAFHHD
jgi:hypothetical protein